MSVTEDKPILLDDDDDDGGADFEIDSGQDLTDDPDQDPELNYAPFKPEALSDEAELSLNNNFDEDEDGDEEEVEELETGAEDSYGPGGALFDTDQGRLPLEARLVLCRLLAGPYIDRAINRDSWNSLVKYEPAVISWLGEVFLELVIDHDLGVGFIRQADTSGLGVSVPSLLRKKTVSFFESLLLIHLRNRLTEAELQGVRATIPAADMIEYLRVYESKDNTDHAKLDNRISKAIYNINNQYYLLRKVGGSEETYEISPTLKLILTPEAISMLTAEYQAYKKQTMEQSETDPESQEPMVDIIGLSSGVFVDPDRTSDSDSIPDSDDDSDDDSDNDSDEDSDDDFPFLPDPDDD
jgi:hypothetical protein